MQPSNLGTVRATIAGTIAVLFSASCWAFSGIFVKLIMTESRISPLALAFWRDLVAGVVFFTLAFILESGRLGIRRSDRMVIAGMGGSLGLFHVALNMGYWLNGAAITTIQQAAMPAIVLIVARLLWKEPLTGLKIFSLTLIGIGTVMVSGVIRAGAPAVSLAGILVGFCVPALYAAWSLFGKALRSGYSAVVTLAWAFGIAALVLLPCQLLIGGLRPPPLAASAYLWFAGLIGISTIFAFFAFTYALGRLPAGIASILVMSEIAFAVFYARLILDETLVWVEMVGAVVVVTGVAILLAPDARRAWHQWGWRR